MRLAAFILVSIGLISMLGLGCSGADSPSPAPPQATWAIHTGIAPVDAFLDRIAANDIDTIAAQAAYKSIKCEKSDPRIADGPLLPCGEGESEGSMHEALTKGCFPFSVVLKDDAPDSLTWLTNDALMLESVYETEAFDSTFALVLVKEGAAPAPAVTRSVVYLTDDGRITSYASCGEFTKPAEPATHVWPVP